MEISCLETPLFRQIYRFAITGGGTTLIHVMLAISLHEYLSVSAFTSNLIAFLVAWFLSYLGNFYWTFDGLSQHRQTILPFMALSIFGFLLNQSIVAIATLYLEWSLQSALIIVVLTVPLFSFLASKAFIFSKQGSQ